MLHLLILAIAIILLVSPVQEILRFRSTSHGTMTFSAVDASKICTDCSIVQASGTIGSNTAKAYREFAIRTPLKRTAYFILDSPGGDRSSAMELGKSLRALQANTIIGNAVPYDGEVEIRPGICTSACVLVFVAGTTRSLAQPSRIGVHNGMPRAVKKQEAGGDEKPALLSQLTINTLSRNIAEDFEYFDSMGIDLRVPVLALKTPHDSIAWIEPNKQKLWGLVTLDSRLSTQAGRRWPVLFTPEPGAPDPSE